jgi:isopentenyl diphosphate isomerase/L-lactate dehydrogenase-like FMN-dependent dehydrogenase
METTMGGSVKRINLSAAADAVKQFGESQLELHQQLLEEVAARNQGLMEEYMSRHEGLWSRLLGRLGEAGMDAPEVLIGSAAMVLVGTALSFFLVSRKR